MVATLAHPPRLRPAPAARPGTEPPAARPGTEPPAATAAPHVTAAVYRRRRLAVLAMAIAVVASAALLAGHIRQAGAQLNSPPPPAHVYVVQPGDTLWSVAGKVAPSVNVREAVGQLRKAAGGSNLTPGQRIPIPSGLRS